MHAHEGAADASITQLVYAMMRMLQVRSVLDVGAGTGAGMSGVKRAFPEAFVCGVEPVAALIAQAPRKAADGCGLPICGRGQALPFLDRSFDAVCEFSTLHHVPNPNEVIREMLRVARKGVFICDSNRFGQGWPPARIIKLLLYKARLWKAYDYVRTAGKGYRITEGDGLSYSYSVYDSLGLISEWADCIILIPSTSEKGHSSWFRPLLTSPGILICALKQPVERGDMALGAPS